MSDVRKFAPSMRYKGGVWSADIEHSVSYHEDGHRDCFGVEERSFWFKHRNDCIAASLEKFPPRSKMIFDIGGGNGYVSKAIQGPNLDVFLVEPGETGVANAKARGVSNIIHSSFQDAGFMPDSLPSVGLFDVVEHIENDRDFLQELYKVLEPGGRLYLTVPAYQWLWSHHDVNSGHYRRYTSETLRKLVGDVGFEIEFTSYFFSALVLPNFIFRSLPNILSKNVEVEKTAVNKNHHVGNDSLFNRLLSPVWSFEVNRIKVGQMIRFGNSLLMVATK